MVKIFLLPIIIFSILNSSNITPEQLKVVYTYNFIKNIEWKDEFTKYKVLVVSSNQELNRLFTLLSSKKKLHNKNIEITFGTSIENIEKYQVIYLDEKFKFLNDELFQKLHNGQLIISDEVKDKKSIMINLISSQNNVTFEINRANILNKELGISSDMVLLGGREIDIATIYKEIQRSYKQKLNEIENLNKTLERQELQKKILENILKQHTQELAKKERLLEDMTNKLNQKHQELKQYEKKMLSKSTQLNKLLKQIEKNKRKLLKQQHFLEISHKQHQKHLQEIKQKQQELEKINSLIQKQKSLISSQVNQIDKQNRKISNLQIAIGFIVLLFLVILYAYKMIIRDKKIIERQFKELETLHQDINQSIKYASYIQNAILPKKEKFYQIFNSSFIVWEPRESVGGDMFFLEHFGDGKSMLIVVDCTSHGVPGALVTMLVKAVEKQLMTEIKYGRIDISSTSDILRYFNREIRSLLNQYDRKESESNVGFDGGVLYIDRKNGEVKYSGAETPLFYVEGDEVKIKKPDRKSIGYSDSPNDYKFKEHIFKIENIKMFYIFTDGYYDQVGGSKKLMFGKKRLLKTLQSILSTQFHEQGKLLYTILKEYQGDEVRRDDITFIGIEI